MRSIGVLSLIIWFAGAAAAQTLQVTHVRKVCALPRPGNNGNVVGHDVGWSGVHNGKSYFLFGDTIVDRDGDDQLDHGCGGNINLPCAGNFDCAPGVTCGLADEFRSGTYFARSTDPNAADCIDLEYMLDAGGKPRRLINFALNEHLTWPAGAVSVGGKFYVFFRAFEPDLDLIGTGLAQVTNLADFQNASAQRIGGGYFFASNEPTLGAPMKKTVGTPCGPVSYLYLFGAMGTAFSPDVYMVRVVQGDIEDPGKYKYWGELNGDETWVDTIFDAVPIFTDSVNRINNIFRVAYNASVDRYVVIYSCGFLGPNLCAAHALTAGDDPSALTAGFSTGVVIHHCEGTPALRCYQGFQHTQYESGGGARIYVTTAKNSLVDQEYQVDLREIDISWQP